MQVSVGIGLTNDCNLACAHCYRPLDGIFNLTLSEVERICDHLPVASMGMGTGENILNPDFAAIVELLRERGIKITMASNGYGLNTLPINLLTAFHDVEVSIDFDNQIDQDGMRGEGNWRDVHAAIDRCHDLGLEVTILACMMSINYDQMDGLVDLARRMGTNFRVNIYQAMYTDRFKLSYEQFWEGYRRLFANSLLISCSEPVVKAALGLGEAKSPCGRQSVRFTPKGEIIPCVYWPRSDLRIHQLPELGLDGILTSPEFQASRTMPAAAEVCRCQGGCASRRALSGHLDAHDDYCPWVRGETLQLDFQMAPAREVLRGGNVCTTIVQP